MFWQRRTQRDFQEELRTHLQIETERLKQEGFSEDDASLAARRAFGNVTRAEERFYESRRIHGGWWADIRFGARMFAKNPGSTIVAIITLALGIGANTAIFSLLNAALLRKLPVPHPQQLVLFGKGEEVGSEDSLPDRSWQLFSYPFFREFRQHNQVFSDVAAIASILFKSPGRVAGGTSLEKINIELVSGSYFHTLGVNAVLGRCLLDSDDRIPGGHPVAVASYSWWERRFASSPHIAGTTVTIDSTVYSVVGVTPSDFSGVTVGQSPDLWIPLAMEKEISPGWNGLDRNLFQSLYLIGRLKPDIDLRQASANTNLLFKQILREYVGLKPSAKEATSIEHAAIDLTPAATGFSPLRRQFSPALEVLMALVVLVLLIACGNIANLLLARATSRRREMAVRMSIGADRLRLIRQLLVESGLLALVGASLGVLLAWGASSLLLVMPSSEAPLIRVNVVQDAGVLGFTMTAAILTVLIFGVAPAFYATQLELAPALKEGRGILGAARNRLSHALVAGQVALSLTLFAAAGLFMRTVVNLMNVDTGFDKKHVLNIEIAANAIGYRVGPRLENMMEQVEERVGSSPGIQAASFAFSTFGGGWTDPVTVPGRPKSDNDPDVFQNIVGSEYLRTMKIPLLYGRALNRQDTFASPKVAIITEAMARTYFPGISPIGRTFSIGDSPEWQNVEVVGVCKDARFYSLKGTPMPAAFYPHSQHGMILYNLVAHYSGNLKAIVPELRNAIHSVDPDLPIGNVITIERQITDSLLNKRLVAQLSMVFGLLAAFLSCVGIYGVVSYGTARRTNEFGIRMALGAERLSVLRMVILEALRVVFIGMIFGLLFAMAGGRLLQAQLFGLKTYDPFSLGAAVIAMLAVALIATYLPARRATRIEPVSALRYE